MAESHAQPDPTTPIGLIDPIGHIFPGIDWRALCVHHLNVGKSKKTVAPKEKKTPGTIMAEEIRARANRLTDAERESLLGDAMRIIYRRI